MRDSFVFYRSFKESISDLSDSDKLILYEAICDFSLDQKEPNLEGFTKALFKLMRPILEANIQRWKNGSKGGAPIGNSNNPNGRKGKPTENQPKTNQELTENQANKDKDKNVNVSTKVDIESDKPKRFIPPSLSEVQSYVLEKGYSIDAANFIDFYTSKGWKVGNNKMKDWKASVRTWERKEKTKKNAKSAEIGIVLTDNSSTKYDNDKLW